VVFPIFLALIAFQWPAGLSLTGGNETAVVDSAEGLNQEIQKTRKKDEVVKP